jgi:hypothetical protein
MAYTLQPTDAVNAGCDPQPFWTEVDASLYPGVYRAKISLNFNGTTYAANGQTAYLVADAEQLDFYTSEFRWDASSILRDWFAREQRNAGPLPLAFQGDLNGWNGLSDLVDSYAAVTCKATYYSIDGNNHEVAAGLTDVSNQKTYINASTQFDEVTSLNAFDPNTVAAARFLTNCPQRQLIGVDEAAFLSFISSKDCISDGGQTAVLYRGYTAAGAQVWSRTLFVDAVPYGVNQVPTGLRQLRAMQAAGDFDLSSGTFTADVDGYTVTAGCYVEGDGFTAFTEVYVYEVTDYCGTRIHFKNTFGVVDSITFTGINQVNNSPVSRFFTRIMDNTTPQTPQMYGRAKYGATDYDIYRLSIDRVNEAQREWLRELQVSPLVCAEIGGFSGKTGNSDFEFLPVVVDDVDGLIYDRTLSVYPFELTMRAARDKFRSVI